MASIEAEPSAPLATPQGTADVQRSETDISRTQIQQQTDELPASTPVEMSHLQSTPHPQPSQTAPTTDQSPPEPHSTSLQATDGASAPDTFPQAPQPVHRPQPPPLETTRSGRARQESEAIGPSSEETPTATSILQQTNSGPDSGPAVLITLILLNGARHPYKIDLRYLRKRNVAKEEQEMDPFEISVYTMKELIWRDWREEWDPRPTIPGSIRLIHFGKLLDDKQSLKDCRFQPATPNVVHMTVRPQEVVDEEENAKIGKAGSSRRGHDGVERESGCCGCVIL